MSASAAFLTALGVAASFAPQEILRYAGSPADAFPVTMLQLAGAAWISLAVVNWTARGALLGGIYGRPIALGNFAQFAIGAIVLVKVVAAGHAQAVLLAITLVWTAFAVWFGAILFGPGPAAPPR